ncbi:hypothetical protein LCGC14_2180430, partial [marine sediment metagenome]
MIGGDDKAQQTTTTDIQRASLSPALQTALQGFTTFLGGEAAAPTPLPEELYTPRMGPDQLAAFQSARGELQGAPLLE